MGKINLFYILAFKEQTYKYQDKLNKIINLEKNNKIKHNTTLEDHFFLLSKHFNLYNFFKYKDQINEFENPVIYHIPYGKDFDTGVEDLLLEYKNKVPIVMRSYDPHSPLKTSKEYMGKYHDLTITYLNKRVNNKDVLFGHMCYDNYLINKVNEINNRKNLVFMILRNRKGKEYSVEHDKFLKKGLDLKKIYGEREKVVKYQDLDVYGSGWPVSMKNYYGEVYPFDQKYTTLKKYKFNLILDNAIVDSYISEKILDSFLTLTVPVYLGSPTTSKYIPEECFIDISEFDNYKSVFEYLKNMSQDEYMSYIYAMKKYRNDIFERFSTKNNISKPIYNWYNNKYNTNLGLTEEEYKNIEKNISDLKFVSSNDFICNLKRKLRLKKEKLANMIKTNK